ncbi:hypothetical protein CLOP_g8409, partial [Closterium sp. NIES-67]
PHALRVNSLILG